MVQGQEILSFIDPGIVNIDFKCFGDSRYWFLTVQGQKILIFGGLKIKNMNFSLSGDQKYRFFVVRGPKILIFCCPGIKNIDFSWSERLCNLQESQKLEKTMENIDF